MHKVICDKCKKECEVGKYVCVRITYSGVRFYSDVQHVFDWCEPCAEEANLCKRATDKESAGELLESLIREIAAEEAQDATQI